MSRTVSLDRFWFVVSNDPEQVIGIVLNMLAANLDRTQLAERLAPNGRGFALDTVGAVARIDSRDGLPEPWDQDVALDPETEELWALYRDPDREVKHTRTYVLTGDELRSLVAQAKALLDARDDEAKAVDAHDRRDD